MRKNNFILSILTVLLLQSLSFANLGTNSVIPIEWQAIKLQENIEEKIKRSLLPIIKPEDYVIEVKIGIDNELAEDPSSKKITKNIQKKKVKFSVAELPKDGDDFVVFNKIGLEAPIVGDEGTEIETSEVELAQKAMIEMNDRFNLFNFLTTIDINLTFDKGLNSKTKESIQKIVKGLSFNTKDIIPQINTQYIDIKSAKAGQEKVVANGMGGGAGGKVGEAYPASAFDRFKNLDVMLGLVLGALLIALAMVFVARQGAKVEEEGNQTNENKNEDEVVAENRDENHEGENIKSDDDVLSEGEDMSIDLTKTDPMTMKINEGLERFRKILTHHYNDMALLVKSWIKVSKGEEAQALKGLVQLLNDNELTEVFKCLNIDERASWKMCLNGELTKEELSKTFHFISTQIIQMMMVPSLIDDYEICDLLLALRAEDAAKYAEENVELGVIFANVLSAKTIGEMFKLLPIETSSEIIEKSTFFKKEDIVNKMPILKKAMLEFKERRERPPFIKRIVDILPTAKPQLEKMLYSTMLRYLSFEDVRDVAVNVFPSDLLAVLPDAIYKTVLEKMPMENQVQYFVALSDEKREEDLNKFAAKGSKSREMLELELNAILKNDMLVARIRNEKKDTIEHEFLEHVRHYLAGATEAQKEISSVIDSWLSEIKNSGQEVSEEKMAA